ncbi:MAG: hypothetical protein A2Z06_03355 [Candidatus Glassbacteria bacterium RBG_16_58_8]|uniref:phenylalanine--tRNA ligase n=1 Tax=Candidatus Glassbacteria bacterium RBG_16_58_8 TaxID=1817866 RepID=A0A1F5YC45_9BACT|nr:MAG: hypothetical protein A2Z06_03355 [Candidatus Glassbacteria bacterium RBG_16_58_8]
MPARTGEGTITVDVPTFRPDLAREIDLIEEVARLAGYDTFNVPVETEWRVAAEIDRRNREREDIKAHLIGLGFREVYTTTFLSQEEVELLFPDKDPAELCYLRNPISSDARVLRPSLIPGLLRVLRLNVSRNTPDLRIFELGTIFSRSAEGGKVPRESVSISGLMAGHQHPVHWSRGSPGPVDFFDMKGVLSSLFKRMVSPPASYGKMKREAFHPGRCATVEIDGKEIGFFGEIHPVHLRQLQLPAPPLLFELDADYFESLGNRRSYSEFSPFPAVRRDLSLLVPKGISHRELEGGIREVFGELLEGITLYDIYTGPQIPSDRLGLTFALVFRSRGRTLKDDEVDGLMIEVLQRMEKAFNVTLRPVDGA